ncbi:deacetoxyvindoline 4-hydroxylase-like [Coffea eugenioides]|uniref:deacetoxyvindoline 4-hydroxylase-like n=1 Tax=Coffea eugenioides TaxID=49369 RepID=UPI000F608BEF|nr:deacetoxyvindoline 4-hydroxylase-like [Coffea eugenioides]
MDESSVKETTTQSGVDDGRIKDLKAFDDTKAGVKGLVDAGVTSLPKIFIRPPDELVEELNHGHSQAKVPVIDLNGIEIDDQLKSIVDGLRRASEEWGFFQVVNHGIPSSVLDGMIDGTRKFHEQDAELKKEYYSRDRMRKVRFDSNIDLYHSRSVNWRDTLTINLLYYNQIVPDELPEICRSSAMDYINHVTKLAETLFELLSEALGMELNNLRAMECARGRSFVCHYYPACPEPDLTLGVNRHTDPAFLTILLQDHIGGLQFLHDNNWTDVPPIPGGLVVNIADLLQIVSNDKFKSREHRVIANRIGPRISVACFFIGVAVPEKIYGPAKELTSDETPAVYREFTVKEYISGLFSRPIDKSGLDNFKI